MNKIHENPGAGVRKSMRAFGSGVLLVAMAVAVLPHCSSVQRPAAPHVVEVPATVADFHPDDALTDARERPDAGAPLGPVVPEKPEPWQKTPPCDFGEHRVNGACYMRWDKEDMMPPCKPGSAEWKRRCYRPIQKLKREKSSVNEK